MIESLNDATLPSVWTRLSPTFSSSIVPGRTRVLGRQGLAKNLNCLHFSFD